MIHRAIIVVLTLVAVVTVVLRLATNRPEWEGGWSWTSPLRLGIQIYVHHKGIEVSHDYVHPGQVAKPELAAELREKKREAGELVPSKSSFVDSATHAGILGLRWGSGEITYMDSLLRATHSVAFIPLWMLFVLFAAYPTISFIRGPLRRRHRQKKGLCVKCAYNLRGLTEPKCPECGTPFEKV